MRFVNALNASLTTIANRTSREEFVGYWLGHKMYRKSFYWYNYFPKATLTLIASAGIPVHAMVVSIEGQGFDTSGEGFNVPIGGDILKTDIRWSTGNIYAYQIFESANNQWRIYLTVYYLKEDDMP